jgi:hypothetical protein
VRSVLSIIISVLQHLLSSPNPTKQSSTGAQNAVQARLRTVCFKSIKKTIPSHKTIICR